MPHSEFTFGVKPERWIALIVNFFKPEIHVSGLTPNVNSNVLSLARYRRLNNRPQLPLHRHPRHIRDNSSRRAEHRDGRSALNVILLQRGSVLGHVYVLENKFSRHLFLQLLHEAPGVNAGCSPWLREKQDGRLTGDRSCPGRSGRLRLGGYGAGATSHRPCACGDGQRCQNEDCCAHRLHGAPPIDIRYRL